ncbi:hypothetical protein FB99_46880 (plasmid) [Pantoea agglomerans]|nr:hypothetical protein FB99_46880 [Pantoea agglomerans]
MKDPVEVSSECNCFGAGNKKKISAPFTLCRRTAVPGDVPA